MINGSPLAPFQHDSSWPDNVVKLFRGAVYRLHCPSPGSDSVNMLREMIRIVEKNLKEEESEDGIRTIWGSLREACNKIVHLKTKGIGSKQEQINLVTNLLSFANLLLISQYGLVEGMSICSKYAPEETSEAAHQKFMMNVDAAYVSLARAIDDMGSTRPEYLNLENSKVISSIPSTHSLATGNVFVLRMPKRTDAYKYHFRLHDPIGWDLVSGVPAKDRFADDQFSVKEEK